MAPYTGRAAKPATSAVSVMVQSLRGTLWRQKGFMVIMFEMIVATRVCGADAHIKYFNVVQAGHMMECETGFKVHKFTSLGVL